MIDLHTHSIFSDGALIPSELARRAQVLGIQAIGITDHVDASNLDFVIPRLVSVADALNQVNEITVVPGAELTHVPPAHISALAKKARALGARIIIVHGETIAEPVAPGTNRAALDADIDILAHPGLISEQEARLAVQKGVFLEVSARKGHCLTNGHVAMLAKRHGAKMVLNTDAHAPSDLIGAEMARRVALGAGLSLGDFETMQENARSLL
ncbi:MAG: histidinol phosphate phosphatase domain-containing protein [Deltaproteobacteria bacterium]|nr:histidinol phosphate phosphatase domain-containing protein [Deltaproteobacteria bacterium]